MVPTVFRFCKESIEDVSHFFFDCSEFKDNFESVWANLKRKILSSNSNDGAQIANFIISLDRQQNALLLLGEFASPLIKQLPLSPPDFYPLLLLKFTTCSWRDCVSCRRHGLLIDPSHDTAIKGLKRG